jgi:hypothetical protein
MELRDFSALSGMPDATPAAMLRQAGNLDPKVFTSINRDSMSHCYTGFSGEARTFKGHVLLGMAGRTGAPNTPAAREGSSPRTARRPGPMPPGGRPQRGRPPERLRPGTQVGEHKHSGTDFAAAHAKACAGPAGAMPIVFARAAATGRCG